MESVQTELSAAQARKEDLETSMKAEMELRQAADIAVTELQGKVTVVEHTLEEAESMSRQLVGAQSAF